jgi:hypothetical protein
MNDEKSFPYWSPKSRRAVIAWHWAGYLVFFDDAIGKLKSYFLMQNAVFCLYAKIYEKVPKILNWRLKRIVSHSGMQKLISAKCPFNFDSARA